MQAIHYFATKLMHLPYRKGRPERIYIVSECKRYRHLHFHLKARFKEHPEGDTFFAATELEEARWMENAVGGRKRLSKLSCIVSKYNDLLDTSRWEKSEDELKDKQAWLKFELER